MSQRKFILCSAPHGGRYAKFDETGIPLTEAEERTGINGTENSKFSEFMPVTVEDTLAEMKVLYEKGVRFFHDHSYDQNGIHACDPVFYQKLEAGLREIDPQLVHSVASSNRRGAEVVVFEKIFEGLQKLGIKSLEEVDVNNQEHLDVFINANMTRFRGTSIPVKPDTITTITNLEYGVLSPAKEGQDVARLFSATHPKLIEGYYDAHVAQLDSRGVNHEIEVSTMRAFEAIEKHFENGDRGFNKIGDPVHFVILFNFTAGLRLTDENVKGVLDEIEKFKERNPDHQVAVSFGMVATPKEAAKEKREKGDELPLNPKYNPDDPGHQPQFSELDYRKLIELTLKHDQNGLVDAFRVGPEDTPQMYGEQRSSTYFVDEMLELFKEYDLGVETDTMRVREAFNLQPRNVERDKLLSKNTSFLPKEVDVIESARGLYEMGFDHTRVGNRAVTNYDRAMQFGGKIYTDFIQQQLQEFKQKFKDYRKSQSVISEVKQLVQDGYTGISEIGTEAGDVDVNLKLKVTKKGKLKLLNDEGEYERIKTRDVTKNNDGSFDIGGRKVNFEQVPETAIQMMETNKLWYNSMGLG